MEHDVIAHDPNKPFTQGWHLDKRIGVAHLLTTASFLFGFGAIMWAMESRVTVVEQRVATHEAVVEVELEAVKETDRQLMLTLQRQYQEIRNQLLRNADGLIRIEEKVDRHAETANHSAAP